MSKYKTINSEQMTTAWRYTIF